MCCIISQLPIMGISLILLVVVLFLPSSTGIHRWIRLPRLGQFQPSEVAKFGLILLFAHLISLNHKKMNTFTRGYLPFMMILLVVCGLVFQEPHLSGTMLLLAIGIIMMFCGRDQDAVSGAHHPPGGGCRIPDGIRPGV